MNVYRKNVQHLKQLDIYRVLTLYNVTHPCLQHAAKKILCAGIRNGGKSATQDVREAIVSLHRYLEMCEEDACSREVTP